VKKKVNTQGTFSQLLADDRNNGTEILVNLHDKEYYHFKIVWEITKQKVSNSLQKTISKVTEDGG
jgi:hypothetical protein